MPVKRQDPPPRSRERAQSKWGTAYVAEAAHLMINPGSWYILKTFPLEKKQAAKSLYTRIQGGRYRAFRPAEAWDATIATEEDEHGNAVVNVYAVYLGDG